MSRAPRKSPDLTWPIISVAVALAIGLGWWIAQRGAPPRPVPPPVTSSSPKTQPAKAPAADQNMVSLSSSTPTYTPGIVPQEEVDRIHSWLTEIDDTKEIAATIVKGWPQLSEDGKVAATPHLLNLIPDERFDEVSRILLEPSTNSQVKDLIFAGLLNRTDEIKWPVIVQIMQQKDHPYSKDARTMLTQVLGKDYGDDWTRWRAVVQERLIKQNPPQ